MLKPTVYKYSERIGKQFCTIEGVCDKCGNTLIEDDLCGKDAHNQLFCDDCLIENHPYTAAEALFGLDLTVQKARRDTGPARVGDVFLDIRIKDGAYKLSEIRNRDGKIKVY